MDIAYWVASGQWYSWETVVPSNEKGCPWKKAFGGAVGVYAAFAEAGRLAVVKVGPKRICRNAHGGFGLDIQRHHTLLSFGK